LFERCGAVRSTGAGRGTLAAILRGIRRSDPRHRTEETMKFLSKAAAGQRAGKKLVGKRVRGGVPVRSGMKAGTVKLTN
jgi:hypothetical protein